MIAGCTNPLPHPPEAERILVIRLGAVGDVVRTLPAVATLRGAYPYAQLSWLVEPPSASLLRTQPWIDEVIVFPRPEISAALSRLRLAGLCRGLRQVAGGLRARRFDLVVDFHAILKSGLLARASGAPERVSYARPFAREGAERFATHHAELAPRRMSRFARNQSLVRFLGVEDPPPPHPLVVEEGVRQRAHAALGEGPAPVALHPGTSDATAHKRWTRDGYAALARELLEGEGIPSVVTCGPARDDRAFAQAVVDASGGAARLAPETRGLPELAGLLSHCRLYVSGDTGPLHVASLVGTPVVQLLGPTDPVENAPYPETPSRTVRFDVGCNPCRRGCAAATCMGVIAPGDVAAAARSLLAGAGGRC